MVKLLNFPVRLRKAYDIARETKVMGARTHGGRAVRDSRVFEAAIKKEYDSCIQFFREWIDQVGVAAVREQILRHPDAFGLSPQTRLPN